ncbi:hypothetical protein [Mycobacterium tuberculosis]
MEQLSAENRVRFTAAEAYIGNSTPSGHHRRTLLASLEKALK